jgi:hypothetical protein
MSLDQAPAWTLKRARLSALWPIRGAGIDDGAARRALYTKGVSRHLVRSLRLGAALCAALVGSTRAASAGNDEGLLVGNQAALTGGAVTAMVSEGSGIWYNPAGIAALSTPSLDLSASAYGVRSYASPRFLQGQSGKSADVNLVELIIVPTALAFVRPIAPDWRLGFGVFAPRFNDYVLHTHLESDADGHWLLAQASVDRVTFLGASVGWNAAPHLRLGAALLGLYRFTQSEVQFSGGTPGDSGNIVFISSSSIEAQTTLGALLSLGVQWEASQNWVLGLSLRSPGVTLFSRASNSDVQTSALGTGVPRLSYQPSTLDQSVSSFTLTAPTQVRWGIAYQQKHGWLGLDGDVTSGLATTTGSDLDPHFNLRLGGMIAIAERLALGAGLFTDRDSEPKSQTNGPLHFYGGSAGVRWGSAYEVKDGGNKRKAFDFTSTLAVRYAYGHGRTTNLVVTVDRQNGEVVPFGDLGKTTITVHELMLHLGSGFYF